ncbi:MAG: phosphoglucosamine mutase [Bacteroidia bacterium]|nr:phosphoglucosamine mutase [Bacteroidia bacterium]MDW8015679.1 phosphoglucosamine mutase [Bacteroidia bacterium]
MALIVSVSGIRGTVEERAGEGLTPVEVVSWVGAWALWLRERYGQTQVVVGQDARPSGEVLRPIAIQVLRAVGHTVYDIGLTMTPTLAMAVSFFKAKGGLMLTASHNPLQWNALKFLNEKGEFFPPHFIQEIAGYRDRLAFPAANHPGSLERAEGAFEYHLSTILRHPWIDVEAIRRCHFRVVVDACNSGGGIYLPLLLEALGVDEVILLHEQPTGVFARPPEPLPENLTELAQAVQRVRADLGIAVDPDVDRVAFFLPNGHPFGEEYTLVASADYVLRHERGPLVTNQSTTMAVEWIARQYQVPFYESRVGEYYVVEKMKAVGAVFGGEGNGGVIWPALHYGRDALAGISLFLSHLAHEGGNAALLRKRYPDFVMMKAKLELPKGWTPKPELWMRLQEKAPEAQASLEDGLKLRWTDAWIHIRLSGTEPLIRIIAEAPSAEKAKELVAEWQKLLLAFLS